MEHKFSSRTLLIIGAVWPEPDSSAAGRRMMQLIDLFCSRGWDIIFASTAAESDHMAELASRGITRKSIQMNDPGFDDFIEDLRPSAVIFDRFMIEEQFGWRVQRTCPHALRILDTEDLHCLRRTRQKAVKQERAFKPEDLIGEEVAKREVASIFRCDLSLIISEVEMQILKDQFEVPGRLLYYLPFLLPAVHDTGQYPDYDQRAHFVTVGNFRHPPNRDAVHFLKKEIWPLIRPKLPDAELHIYGAYPTHGDRQLHHPEFGFHIKGRVEDVKSAVRRARVSLAPLRFGAGLKGKLVEAMQCGTPSVTTPVGAEGMAGDYPWSGKIAGNAEQIANAATALYTNRQEWEEAQNRGIQLINGRFNRQQFAPAFMGHILKLLQGLESHRRHNFIGGMLMHHSMASTKYMSRWIEEKNRQD